MKGKIFNAQEVQAILNGSKVMFREVIKPQIIKLTDQQNKNLSLVDGYTFNNEIWADLEGCKKVAIFRCPYQVGQKIFCKERFARSFDNEGNPIAILEADNKQERKWRPASQMKQEHSRLTLLIKEIRVEKLADISEEDIEAEGIKAHDVSGMLHLGYISEKDAFIVFWNFTHKKPEEKFFEASPFVWCVNFEVINN